MRVEGGEGGALVVGASLSSLGFHFEEAWLLQAKRACRKTGREADRELYEFALYSDLRQSSRACLPPEVRSMHKQTVNGTFVLQIDEIVNISEPNEHRLVDTRGRMLKLLLTDGTQDFCGLELNAIRDLSVNSPAGLKVLVKDFEIRRGVALFGPHNLCVLGGMCSDLEKRRQKCIAELEKSRTRLQLIANDSIGDDISNHEDFDANQPSRRREVNHLPSSGSRVSANDFMRNTNQSRSNVLDEGIGQPKVEPEVGLSNRSDHAPLSFKFLSEGVTNSSGESQVPLLQSSEADMVMYEELDRAAAAAAAEEVLDDETEDLISEDPAYAIMLEAEAEEPQELSKLPATTSAGVQARNLAEHSDAVEKSSNHAYSQLFYLIDLKDRTDSHSTFRVKAAVTHVVKFLFDGEFSLHVGIDDGSQTSTVQMPDAMVASIMEISCREYCSLDKKAKSACRHKFSAKLTHLEGVFTLKRIPNTSEIDQGVAEWEVINLDPVRSEDAYFFLERCKKRL